MRHYIHNGKTYEVQFYGNDIHLESPDHELVIEFGYADFELEAIINCADHFSDNGREYDRVEVDNYIEEFWEEYIKQNIDKAQLIENV